MEITGYNGTVEKFDEKSELTFASTDERNRWLSEKAPMRRGTQSPGVYRLPGIGGVLVVFCEKVTLWDNARKLLEPERNFKRVRRPRWG